MASQPDQTAKSYLRTIQGIENIIKRKQAKLVSQNQNVKFERLKISGNKITLKESIAHIIE